MKKNIGRIILSVFLMLTVLSASVVAQVETTNTPVSVQETATTSANNDGDMDNEETETGITEDTTEDTTEGVTESLSIQATEANIDSPAPIVNSNPLNLTSSVSSTGSVRGYVIGGDSVTVSIESPESVTLTGYALIGTQSAQLVETATNVYEATAVMTENYMDGEEITAELVIGSAVAASGRMVSVSNPTNSVRFVGPLKVSNITLSNGRDDNYVLNNDIVSVSFSSNRSVQIAGSAVIAGQSVAFSNSGNEYMATLLGRDLGVADGSSFDVSCSVLTLTDSYGRTVTTETAQGSYTYYSPMVIGNGISGFTMTTTNEGTSSDGTKLVKDGDSITISFKTKRNARVNAMIGGTSVSMNKTTEGTSAVWEGTVKVSGFSDNATVPISVSVADWIWGGETTTLTESNFGIVRYYAPIQAQSVMFETNNANNSEYAINGNTAFLNVTANHEVSVDAVSIEGEAVAASGNQVITASNAINGNTADQGRIGYSITMSDAAGNTSLTVTGDNITYYAPIQVSGVSFTSTNAKDSARFAKDGDSVALRFSANHTVSVTGTVGGTGINGDGQSSYSFEDSVNGLADQSSLGYSVTVNDAAGNDAVIVTDNTAITYYAPISASTSLTATYTKTAGYIKNGDVVTASVSANHAISFSKANILGTGVSDGTSGSNITATLYIAPGENSLPEGPVSFAGAVEDVAGNTANVEKSENIIYDRTAPVIRLSPVADLFSNMDIQITANYTDTNLDGSDTELLVNGINRVGAGEATGSTFTKTITLDAESEYEFSAGASDLAGNVAQSAGGRFIIDKTNPDIVAINIDMDVTPVYKSGVKISDFFKVNDTYLKEIICSITSHFGSGLPKTIGIDDAIGLEGLQKVEIYATDMANNSSKKLTYSFYVDGTAPKPVLTVKNTNKVLDVDTKAELAAQETIEIALDEIWMGDESADTITKLQLVDKDGKTKNLLNTNGTLNQTEVKIADGEQQIIIEAEDAVGNKTETITYKVVGEKEADTADVSYAAKSLGSNSVGGNGAAIAFGSIAIGGAAAFCGFKLYKKRKAK